MARAPKRQLPSQSRFVAAGAREPRLAVIADATDAVVHARRARVATRFAGNLAGAQIAEAAAQQAAATKVALVAAISAHDGFGVTLEELRVQLRKLRAPHSVGPSVRKVRGEKAELTRRLVEELTIGLSKEQKETYARVAWENLQRTEKYVG
eukprot:SAG11_NODE_2917_length_2839_cov_1.643431_1_plen_152_part_00